jgi:hypothetical protein
MGWEWERLSEWLTWGWLLGLATLVPAVIALVTFLASVPFSPARFYAWQLRRQGETLAALDPVRHKNQREVLQGRVDHLANKAAAAQIVPTPWKRYVIGAFIWSYLAWMTFLLVWQGPSGPPGTPSWPIPPGPMGWVFAIWFQLMVAWAGLRSTLVYAVNNRRERAKFIAAGCPPDFVPRPHLHERIRAAEVREMEQAVDARRPYRRARQMWRDGTMPAEWRPRSRGVVRIRQFKWITRRALHGVQKQPMPRVS